MFRQSRDRLIWFALVAMAALAFAPALSQLTHQLQGLPQLSEVCSATGPPVQGTSRGTESGTGVEHLESCALCAHAMSALGAPPADRPSAGMSNCSLQLAPVFPEARRTVHEWSRAQPRGPPAHA